MPAHMIPLHWTCEWADCTRSANWVVRSTWNREVGRYCKRHAEQRVAKLLEVESR